MIILFIYVKIIEHAFIIFYLNFYIRLTLQENLDLHTDYCIRIFIYW